MLKNTFCHIPGITPQTESLIWELGIKSWDEFLDEKNESILSKLSDQKRSIISNNIQLSLRNYENKDFSFFKLLPKNQHWRVYEHLIDDACFLDIETTGLSKDYHDITLIGVHSKYGTKIFKRGKNLDEFKEELKKFALIVTFNGSCFDIPFLLRKYPDLEINHFHLDLRYLMARLGYRGGLKKIEIEVGISRDDDLDGVDGFEAVRLWRRYERGDEEAYKKLEKYLIADVENLRILMDFTYRELQQLVFNH